MVKSVSRLIKKPGPSKSEEQEETSAEPSSRMGRSCDDWPEKGSGKIEQVRRTEKGAEQTRTAYMAISYAEMQNKSSAGHWAQAAG